MCLSQTEPKKKTLILQSCQLLPSPPLSSTHCNWVQLSLNSCDITPSCYFENRLLDHITHNREFKYNKETSCNAEKVHLESKAL
jgi:hypothetical protein